MFLNRAVYLRSLHFFFVEAHVHVQVLMTGYLYQSIGYILIKCLFALQWGLCFPRMSMFASTSPRETLRFQGNKIHCCCHIRVTLQVRFVESTFELSVGHVLLTA